MRFLLSLLIFVAAFVPAAEAGAPLLSSLFAAGRWVRVEADTTGIFEISREELLDLGFEKPAEVAVYGYGGIVASGNSSAAIPDDITPTAYMHTADGRLLFYAEADVRATLADGYQASFIRNCFDTAGVYFLSDVKPTLVSHDYPFGANASETIDSHFHIELIEREIQSPWRVGTVFHSVALEDGASERYTFPIENYRTLPTGSMVMLRYDIAVNSPEDSQVDVKLSGNVKQVLNTPLQTGANLLADRLYTVSSGNVIFTPPSAGAFDNTTVDVDFSMGPTFGGSYAALDRAYIIYPRSNRIGSGELIMNLSVTGAPRNLTVSGADSDVEVWNVSNPTDIRRYATVYDGATRTASLTIGHENMPNLRLVAFNPSGRFRTPIVRGAVPTQNLHASRVPDYLIVCTAALREAAEELAAIHRSLQGLDVAVVCQDAVYNEFSSGMRMPDAIRRYVKMLVDREPGKLRYLLFYGAPDWDVRNITGSRGDCLPSYVCEAPQLTCRLPTAYCSDIFFGMTDDDFDPQTIYKARQTVSVGRMPLADAAEARHVNEKSRRRLLAAPSPEAFLHAVKFSDDGDNRAHFDYSEQAAALMLDGNAAMTVSRADNHLYPWTDGMAAEASRKLRESLRAGVGLMFYTGHGSATGLTAQQIYNLHSVATEAYSYAPLAFFASCVTFPYCRRQISLVPQMVFSGKGGAVGAVGAVGACQPVYLEQNRLLCNSFAAAYAAARPGDSGADVFRAARENLISAGITSAAGVNTLNYNYCGDPALPLGAPDLKVEFEGADGSMTFRPLEISALRGRITDAEGVLDTDFKGTALIQVYDLPYTLRTLRRNNDDGDPIEVEADDRLLVEYTAEVSAGEFSLDLILPEAAGDGLRRVIVTAVDTVTGKVAAGVRRDLDIADAAATSDAAAPEILDFSTGAMTVCPSFTASARVSAGLAGLAPQSAFVPGVSVTVDGRAARVNIRRSSAADGITDLEIDFNPLAPGAHNLVLRVVNSLGVAAERSLNVLVAERTLSGTLTVEDVDPARTSAMFSLDAPDDAEATLVIVAADGSTTLRREACAFPFEWNLDDTGGRPVADGTYRAWALLKAGGACGSTKKVEITVLKPVQDNKN